MTVRENTLTLSSRPDVRWTGNSHFVISTVSPVNRKLSFCHLDRRSCGPEWRDLTYFKNRFLDFGLCPPLEMTYRDNFTIYHGQYCPRWQGYIAEAKLFKDCERECKKKKNIGRRLRIFLFFIVFSLFDIFQGVIEYVGLKP